MNYIQECETQLNEHRAALRNTQAEISAVPEVLIAGVTALYTNDRKTFDEFAERVLLGAAATLFTQGAKGNSALAKARTAVLEGRPSLNATTPLPEHRLDVATDTFHGALRAALEPYTSLLRYRDNLIGKIRAKEAAIEFALAALASRSIHTGASVLRKDLGYDVDAARLFTALAAECAWSKEADVRLNLADQLSFLAADVPENQEQFKKLTGYSWKDWVYVVFEVSARRPAPWAANYARLLHQSASDAT
jgi:hypothetical protein